MKAEQVTFKTPFDGSNKIFGGILVNDEFIICGDCGGIFEAVECEIIDYLKWIDLSEYIIGEEA